jgi:DNA repair exonuclease SbcCD ATPase subunit
MPNGQRKSGKSAHANKQRAKEREEMNAKIKDITKSYEENMEFLETRSKELTEEIAKTKKDMIKKNEEIEEKLSKSRAKFEELQTEHIKIMNEKIQANRASDKVIDNLNIQGANMMKDIVKYKAVIMKYEPNYFDSESESESEEEEEKNMCSLCENKWDCPYGHNGSPLVNGRVCDKCNKDKIIQYRMLTAMREMNVSEIRKNMVEQVINPY